MNCQYVLEETKLDVFSLEKIRKRKKTVVLHSDEETKQYELKEHPSSKFNWHDIVDPRVDKTYY